MQELLDMQELFKQIIKQDVKPFFSAQGYRTKDLNFYKTEGQFSYKINIQKYKYNTYKQLSFYVNYNLHSEELAQYRPAKSLGLAHFYARINQIVPAAPERYFLTPEVDVDKFTADLLLHLDQGLQFLYTLTDARAIIEYYMQRTALHLSEETFGFLLDTGETETAEQYLKQLQAKYGAEKRWAIWEQKYAAVWEKYGSSS
ncbi:DUF4304 domain-containing protein [Paenibacillus sp. FSL H7-0756]|uniref:DUF4304 domain-containing protein n=1 Tax=unclassified Paenibacillus TaxID=185978 RepID=UPI0030F54702